MSWIERKSVESQLRNTTYGVHQLVAAANVLTAAWGAGKQPSPEALAEFQRRKNKLVSDMHGLAGVSQLRRVLIEPELEALQAHPDARSAVLSVCDWIAKQTGDTSGSGTTFSDEEITAMISRSRRGFVARLLGVGE